MSQVVKACDDGPKGLVCAGRRGVESSFEPPVSVRSEEGLVQCSSCRSRIPVAAVAAVGVARPPDLVLRGGAPPRRPPPHDGPAPAHAHPSAGRGRDSFNHSSCPLGKGDVNADVQRRRVRPPADEVEAAMDLLVQQKPQIFDLRPRRRARHQAVPGAGQGGVPERPRRQPARGRACAPSATPTTSSYETHPGQERERLLGGLRRPAPSAGFMRRGAGIYRETCTPVVASRSTARDAPPAAAAAARPYPPAISASTARCT